MIYHREMSLPRRTIKKSVKSGSEGGRLDAN